MVQETPNVQRRGTHWYLEDTVFRLMCTGVWLTLTICLRHVLDLDGFAVFFVICMFLSWVDYGILYLKRGNRESSENYRDNAFRLKCYCFSCFLAPCLWYLLDLNGFAVLFLVVALLSWVELWILHRKSLSDTNSVDA